MWYQNYCNDPTAEGPVVLCKEPGDVVTTEKSVDLCHQMCTSSTAGDPIVRNQGLRNDPTVEGPDTQCEILKNGSTAAGSDAR